ncbi:MAG: aldehyde dehydrogenase family protein [Ilumatobacteraceae bacterium]|nr:aldehyde dehydrogenase family protein [Ilumatobacteraceae bacterium]
MTTLDQLYINGSWVPSASTETIDVFDSLTETVMGSIPAGDASDVAAAVAAAKTAFETWSVSPVAERTKFLGRIADGLDARTDELAALITRETGMALDVSRPVQVGGAAYGFRQAAALAESFHFESTIANSLVVREPIGVVGCITPWNYPLLQIAAKVAFALAAGCTVVLKPSEIAPIDAFILAEVIDEVGLPAGVFNLVSGYGPTVGEAIAAHPDVDMVSFTGSNRAGRRVAQLAAETVKKVAMELGGKSANILLDDLDDAGLAAAITDGVGKAFVNSGQSCDALTRMLVPAERLADAERILVDVVSALTVGDPFVDGTDLGPLASAAQRDRVQSYIQKGVDEGAEIIIGGLGAPDDLAVGYYVRPTVFSKVSTGMTIAQEEIFGPVLALMPYGDTEEAIRIANDSVFGLGGGVWSADADRARGVARRIRTGQIEINGGAANPDAPFGGYKQSGVGREYGMPGLEEFLEFKSIQQ